MSTLKKPSRRLLLSAALLLSPALALADFPDKPLRLSVGFPAGTGPDVVARTLGQQLGEQLKQTLVIDNKAGAGGQIAAQSVAKGVPDGYNLLLGEVGSISIAPAAFRKLPYDPMKELVAVGEVARSDFVLVVPLQSGHKTLGDFLKATSAAKARGERINFGTFGAGTPGHFGAEMLAEQAGFGIEPIHYRATGDAITAIVAGDVQAAFMSTALATAQIKGGKVLALATTAPARLAQLPEVPTFTEAGLPKIDFSAWFAVFAPAGTPAAVLDVLNRQLVAALQNRDTRSKLQDAGFSVRGGSREDAQRMLQAESIRWAAVVKATGFKGD